MQIRRLTIRSFRGIENLVWCPGPGVNCLIGPGDAGKSCILAAVALLLAPYPPGPASEFDYYRRRIEGGFEIEAVIGGLSGEFLGQGRIYNCLRGWLSETVVDLPDEGGAEPVLVCRVRGTPEMELKHEIVLAGGETTEFSVARRKALTLARLSSEERAPRDLRLGAGSVLDRALGRLDMRAPLHQAVARASADLQLPPTVSDALQSLSIQFSEAGLPTYLHLGLVPTGGVSLPGMVTLLEGEAAQEAIPIALSGSGTRHLALLAMSAGLAGDQPVVVVDEPERALEPYRQRLAAQRIVELVRDQGQAFVTTHAPAVLETLPIGTIHYVAVRSAPRRLAAPELQRLQKHDPEAFFSRLPLVCEGETEIGLLGELLPSRLGRPLEALGIRLVDGGGQPSGPRTLEALCDAGITCAGFFDNETAYSGIRARLSTNCILFVWRNVCDVEEAVARHLPTEHLSYILEWAADVTEQELRHLVPRVRQQIGDQSGSTLEELLDRNGEPVVRNALYAAMKSGRGWFKSIDGGRRLASGLADVGIPDAIEAQMAAFTERLAGALQ